MGNKGKFVAGLLVIAIGVIAICLASSTAVHEYLSGLFT